MSLSDVHSGMLDAEWESFHGGKTPAEVTDDEYWDFIDMMASYWGVSEDEVASMLPRNENRMSIENFIRRRSLKGLLEAVGPDSMGPLSSLLAMLRAASHLHQTHHWQTNGPGYYADHLLFGRLYEESQSFIDQVAERAVGSGDSSLVDPVAQIRQMVEYLESKASPDASPASLVQASLSMETQVLAVIDQVRDALEASGSLSNGTDNLLQGAADLHETFIYLLKQRSS